MTKRFLLIATSFALLLTAFGARADGELAGPAGFVASLPEAASRLEMEALRAELSDRREALARTVAEAKMKAGDVLIAIFAPGGLLHAANKAAKKAEASEALARVDEDLALVDAELTRMASLPLPAGLALAQIQ